MSKIENAHTRLRTARMAAGFKTATEFCEKYKIPISTYNMHETGKRKLMPNVAEKYADFLQLNPAWLITGTGSPYSEMTVSEDTSNLTEQEYLKLLNYNGNKKIFKQQAVAGEKIQSVDPIVFCKIIIEIIEVLKSYNMSIDLNLISNYAIEIYNDIAFTSNSHKDQLTMVNLAITIFKRQLHELTQQEKQVINK